MANTLKDKIHHKFIVFKDNIFLIGGSMILRKTNNDDWDEIELTPKTIICIIMILLTTKVYLYK